MTVCSSSSGISTALRRECPRVTHRSSDSITCLAIGAATVPPWPVVRSTVTAIATRGSLDRREGDEPGLVRAADLGGAGLARDVDAGQRRRRSGSLLDDLAHHRRQRARGRRLHDLALLARLHPLHRPAVGVAHLARRGAAASACRRWRSPTPPSPSGAASPAAAPGRSRRGRCRRRRSRRAACRCRNTPLARSSSRGRSIGGLLLKPKRRMYSYIVSLPSRSPTWPQTVLTEFVSAVVSVTGPKSSLPKLVSGTPPIFFGESPSSTDCGCEAAAVERRRRRHDLEGRARRIAALRRAVEQRRSGRPVQLRELVRDAVGVEVRHRRHHPHAAGLAARSRPPSRRARRAPGSPSAAPSGSSVVTRSSPSRSLPRSSSKSVVNSSVSPVRSSLCERSRPDRPRSTKL